MRIRRWLPAATMTTAIVLGTPAPAMSSGTDAPHAVEDGSYPNRADVLAATGADLISGDGNITHTTCSDTYQIMVWARDLPTQESRVCFKAAGTGFLTVNIPRAYRIETNDRDIKASVSIDGTTESLTVPRDTSKGFGESNPNDPQQAVLLKLQVTGTSTPATPPPAGNNPYAFVGKLRIGETGACTAVLVDPLWALTASTCFSANGKPAVGKPALPTTLTVGRNDLTEAGGSVQQVLSIVPHPDRNLTLVRLSTKVGSNVTPVRIATTPAATGEQLTKAGFGRTKTEWVPNKLHTGAFTVASTTGADVNLNGSETAMVCQGDAGGPALRMVNGTPELVAVGSRSWQGGCLGTDPAETRTAPVDTRVDDVRTWIADTTFRAQGDMTGDRIADLTAIWDAGSLHVYTGSAQGLTGQRTQQYGGTSWVTTKQLVKGDFTSDGIADVMAVWNDGTLHLYKGDGKGNIGGPSAALYGGDTWSTVKQMTAGDFDGDGRTDILAVWNSGTLNLYRGDGNGNIAKSTPAAMGGDTGSIWGTITQFVGGDFDRDGIADLMAVWNDGTLHFYKSKGDGNFNSHLTAWGNTTWSTVRLMTGDDYNADGAADLMAVWANGTLHLYKGDGKGNITPGIDVWGGTTWSTVKHIA
ncbi:FG-GAP-like repeat-containing protein [Streptomyces sp. NPDC058861]|uniref:FG-GAP-like repeat-containing protein n=1 Tax=Streptomyces sp. NPDC058861 TaxID=3346653 RepID=UPI0036CAFF84